MINGVPDSLLALGIEHSYAHFMKTIAEQISLVQSDIENDVEPMIILSRLQFAYEFALAAVQSYNCQKKAV